MGYSSIHLYQMTPHPPSDAGRILRLLDLTNLNELCSETDIDALCASGQTRLGSIAAVCIWPRFIAHVHCHFPQLKIATVVNFPNGNDSVEAVLRMTRSALKDGADEIDLVMPYQAFLAGDFAHAHAMIEAVAAATSPTAKLKVILETGALQETQWIRGASELAIAAGADFLKTSTGKIAISATLPAAKVMLEVIAGAPRQIGFKAAGGVRTLQDARAYLDLADDIMGADWARPATFRFGASALLQALLSESDPLKYPQAY